MLKIYQFKTTDKYKIGDFMQVNEKKYTIVDIQQQGNSYILNTIMHTDKPI